MPRTSKIASIGFKIASLGSKMPARAPNLLPWAPEWQPLVPKWVLKVFPVKYQWNKMVQEEYQWIDRPPGRTCPCQQVGLKNDYDRSFKTEQMVNHEEFHVCPQDMHVSYKDLYVIYIEPAGERNRQNLHAIAPNQPLESQNKAHGP